MGHHTRRTKNSHKEGIKKENDNHKAAKVRVQKTDKKSKCNLTHNDHLKALLKSNEKNNLQVQKQSKEQNSLHNVQPKLVQQKKRRTRKEKKCFRYN